MWEFPSIQNFIASNSFIVIWTLGVFAASAYAWIYVYLSIKRDAKESAGQFLKNVAVGSATFLIMIFSSYGLTSRYNEVSQCRNLDLMKVKAIRVKRMPSEDTFGGTTILINDSNKIREGLKILKSASSRDRKKDRFIYGYQIRLILEEDTSGEFYLNYFAE